MGNSVFKRLFADRNVRILIIGYDDSGHILRSLKLGKLSLSMPEEGVFAEELRYKNVEMTSLDLGGRMSIRPLLPHYYATIQGLVFVLDCSWTCFRVNETLQEYCCLIEEYELPNNVPVLVLANNHETSLDDIKEKLGKEKCFSCRRWVVHGISLDNKEENGLFEAFDWLSDEILAKEKQKMALDILARNDTNGKITTPGNKASNKEDKSFLSKFIESLKKTLVCRPVIKSNEADLALYS